MAINQFIQCNLISSKRIINCSGSFAWSALGPIQGLYAIKSGNLTLLSWQQIIDCSKTCQGTVHSAFQMAKSHGINTQQSYPYLGNIGECKSIPNTYKIKQYSEISNCNDLSSALTKGPVSVYVDASKFAFYSSGIFTNCNNSLNLAVVLVGMSPEYWKLKLNWGISWGQQGYMRIAQGNTCGICQMGTIPVL